MDLKFFIRKLEAELKCMFEEYGNDVPVHELERFGYVQGYLDALREIDNVLDLFMRSAE